MKRTQEALISAMLGNYAIPVDELVTRLRILGELHVYDAFVDASAGTEVHDHLTSQQFLSLGDSRTNIVHHFKLLGSGDDTEVLIYVIDGREYLGVRHVEIFSTIQLEDPAQFLIKQAKPEVKDAKSLASIQYVTDGWLSEIAKDWKLDIDTTVKFPGLFSIPGYREKLQSVLSSFGIKVLDFDDSYADFSRPQDGVVAGFRFSRPHLEFSTGYDDNVRVPSDTAQLSILVGFSNLGTDPAVTENALTLALNVEKAVDELQEQVEASSEYVTYLRNLLDEQASRIINEQFWTKQHTTDPHGSDLTPEECRGFAARMRARMEAEGFEPHSGKSGSDIYGLRFLTDSWIKFDISAKQATIVHVEVNYPKSLTAAARPTLKMWHFRIGLTDAFILPSECDELIQELVHWFTHPDRKVYTLVEPAKPQKGKLARWFDRIRGL